MYKESKKRLLLGGYFSALKDQNAKKGYLDKLRVVNGLDPYETERKEWKCKSRDVSPCHS